MSHAVTITRTTTTTANTSYVVVNTGYLKSLPGILKLFQLILGAVCVAILSYYSTRSIISSSSLFFFLIATAFMIGTFCLLLSCLTSLSTGEIISRTIYELIYHSIAAILLLIASVILLIELRHYRFDAYMAAVVIGLINSVLYFISAFYAHKSYRGI